MHCPRLLRLFALSFVVFSAALVGTSSADGATLTVTSLGDAGPGTLRQSVHDAAAGDAIVFGVNGTIVLQSEIIIQQSISIDGPGAANLTVSGNGQTRVFRIEPGSTVSISGITISDGEIGDIVLESGGGIWNQGTLSLSGTVFRHNVGNWLGQGGDAIDNTGSVSVTTSTFDSNTDEFADGGGIRNEASGILSVSGVTFVHNVGRAIYNRGTATVVNSTFWADYPGTGALGGFNGVAGAGIYNDKGATLSAINNTFAGDPSAPNRSAPSGFANHGAIPELWNNLFVNTACFQLPGGSGNLSDSPSGDQSCPSRNLDFNAATDVGLFGNYGGPTETIELVGDGTNPAIDGGGPGCPPYDQRGAARVGTCDVGAFEYGGSLTTVTATGDSGLGTLREAVSNAGAGDIITFRARGTITLSTPIVIDKNLSIVGPGAGGLTVTGGGTADGGAFAVTANATVAMSSFIVANAQACSQGCGVYNDGVLAVTDMVFDNNYAANGGGAIYSSNELTVRGSTFNSNLSSAAGGGAVLVAAGHASVYDSTFDGNYACQVTPFAVGACSLGGAIGNGFGTLVVSDSTFYRNISGAGGAIMNGHFGVADIRDSTFASNGIENSTVPNLPSSCGGAICNVGTLQVSDTLFANNNTQYVDNSCSGVGLGTANLSDAASAGCPGQNSAFTSSDLGTLADNGGPTATMALLSPGSNPAIDSGVDCTPLDQRGVARFGPCDIGAYELVPVDPTTHVKLNTPPGVGPNGGGVVVAPVDATTTATPLAIRFPRVIQEGTTSLTTSSSGPPPPAGLVPGDPAVYYDITTTSTFMPPVDICVGYGGITFSTTDPRLGLYQYDTGSNDWTKVTTSIDTDSQLICGTVKSLMPLAVFETATPPVANAGANQTLECTGNFSASATLDGSASTAPNGDTLTYKWTDANGNLLGTMAELTVTAPLRAPGPTTSTYELTVTDTATGLTDSATSTVTVQDTAPPVLTLSRTSLSVLIPTASATGVNASTLNLDQYASATDACDPNPTVTNSAPPVLPIGTTRVSFVATDHCNNKSAAQMFQVDVGYRFSGYFAPVLSTGQSLFKSGRAIPVKFELTAADGTIVANAIATLAVIPYSSFITGNMDFTAATSKGHADTGNMFRFDPISGEYVFNLSTSGLAPGTWLLRTTLNDGTYHDVVISIR